MLIVNAKKPISKYQLKKLAQTKFGDLIKAVVDIEKEQMVVDAELHADEEAWLIELGSKQKNLWGINLYPDLDNDDFIEFDSMINLRPSAGNLSRGIDDIEVRQIITQIVGQLVK
ncbi:MAG: DUF5674 family protein [Patescibacteria group bacterium]